MRFRLWRRLALLTLPASVLLSGCLASVQGNLDLLLGRNALENALRLPYSVVWPLFRVLRLFGD